MPPDTERAAARGVRAEFVFHESNPTRLHTVVKLLDQDVRVLLDRTVSLADATSGLAHLANGHARGKIIVTP